MFIKIYFKTNCLHTLTLANIDASIFQIGEYCFRISPVKETYQDAEKQCESEMAHLAFINSEELQQGIEGVLATKKSRFDFYKDATDFWLGARLEVHKTTQWEWKRGWRPMKAYTNWKARVTGYGCHNTGCEAQKHGMFMKIEELSDWRIANKTEKKGYDICLIY